MEVAAKPAMSDMRSRRDFLQSASITSAFALAQSAGVRARQDQAGSDTLPDPISKLKSRRSEALPITAEERQGRWERARRLMAENNLDGIILSAGTSLLYFAGIHWSVSERL